MAKRQFDLVIVGAGGAGLSTAIAAKITLGPTARILVCAPGRHTQRQSIQAYAISAAPKNLLERIGVWSKIARIQPIHRMEITDSELGDVVRQTYLEFDSSENSSGPLAHIIPHNDLISALEETAGAAGIEVCDREVTGFQSSTTSVSVKLNRDETITAGLLVGCDGATSQVRNLARIQVVGWNYDREAIVATIAAEHDHGGTAVQHFLPAGTFALLPRNNNHFSVVWVEKPQSAAALCHLQETAFIAELQKRAGNAFGKLELREGPTTFPLQLQIARRFVSSRLVLIGDAAHTMHPLAGQGLNLGLRDVGYLMAYLGKQAHLGLDIGQPDNLHAYEQSRRSETVKMLAATDALFRIFTTEGRQTRLFRRLGLGLIDRLPILKSTMIGQAAGDIGHVPGLLSARS